MAENRGGYRKPTKPASSSGVGKNSRRTDGQAVRAPNVQDSTELTQGDRQVIEQGQRTRPLGDTPGPRFAPPRGEGATGGPTRARDLPDYLMEMESARPMEPLTEGLDQGPGAGPEVLTPPEPDSDMEVVLQFLVDQFQDDAANKMLNDHRAAKQAPEPIAMEPMRPEPTLDEPEAEPEVSASFDLAVAPDEEVPTDEVVQEEMPV